MDAVLDNICVLVLEDEFLIAMDVEQTCRDFGASDVILARSLEEAATVVSTRPFDAAIVDIMLGGSSTLDFASQLERRGVPFVFASGYSDLHEINERFPNITVVGKPYDGNRLVDALADSIRQNEKYEDGSRS